MKSEITGYVILICFVLFSSKCESSKDIDKTSVISMNQGVSTLAEIQQKIKEGNSGAYEELRTIYLDFPNENLLYWAIYCAHRYDNCHAFDDAFEILVFSEIENIEEFGKINFQTRKMAIGFLKKSRELGCADTNNYWKLIEKYEQL